MIIYYFIFEYFGAINNLKNRRLERENVGGYCKIFWQNI